MDPCFTIRAAAQSFLGHHPMLMLKLPFEPGFFDRGLPSQLDTYARTYISLRIRLGFSLLATQIHSPRLPRLVLFTPSISTQTRPSTATMVSFAIVATLISSAAALGINCRGSGGCTFNTAQLSDVLTQVKQVQAQGKGNHHYNTGGKYLPTLSSCCLVQMMF